MNLKDLPDLLTVTQAAHFLRLSPLTLKRWGKQGKIVPMRINKRGDRRYKKSDLEKLINYA